MSSNDNHLPGEGTSPPSDAHGRAALLLVESLIHGLCDKSMLSTGEAIEIAERAVNVQNDQADEAEAPAELWRSHALLTAIAASLSIDDESEPSTPRLV